MAFGDRFFPVELGGECVWGDARVVSSQSHGSAEVDDLFLFLKKRDDRVLRLVFELRAVGAGQSAGITGELNAGNLHAKTDPQEWNSVLAGIGGGQYLPFDPPLPESSGNEDTVEAMKVFFCAFLFDLCGIEAHDFYPTLVMCSGVCERFIDRFIGILQTDVFPDHSDADVGLRVDDPSHEVFPIGEVRSRCFQTQCFTDKPIELVLPEVEWAFVDGGFDVAKGNDVFGCHVTEHGDLLAFCFFDFDLGAADDDVRDDADLSKFGHALLGGFGLHFSGGPDKWKQCDVDEAGIFRADLERELTQCLEENVPLDIAYRSADLSEKDVCRHFFRHLIKATFNLVGDVRNVLDGSAQVVPFPFLFDHTFKDLAGTEAVES